MNDEERSGHFEELLDGEGCTAQFEGKLEDFFTGEENIVRIYIGRSSGAITCFTVDDMVNHTFE